MMLGFSVLELESDNKAHNVRAEKSLKIIKEKMFDFDMIKG